MGFAKTTLFAGINVKTRGQLFLGIKAPWTLQRWQCLDNTRDHHKHAQPTQTNKAPHDQRLLKQVA